MKIIVLLVVMWACATIIETNAQNCTNTSVGYPRINDLATGFWQGSQGGLYPGGSNYRPAYHNQQGLLIASQIQPLDSAGNIDLTNGKVIWLSIGMSNTTGETQAFIAIANTFQDINPKLEIIDGAQGGQHINIIINPNANYWQVINSRLASAEFTPKQVQVIWFKQAEAQPTDTTFATYPDALKIKYRAAVQIIKAKYPNTKLCYLSPRIYAGYATTALNPEPFAYYTGWTIKRLIEDQINGDTALAYRGVDARAPWLAWGPNLWADGTTPNSDGLTWICPDDFNSDGTHPSATGRQKVAQKLLDFFTTDSTACSWFLGNCPMTTGINAVSDSSATDVYPNPFISEVTIRADKPFKNARIVVYNSIGQHIKTIENVSGSSVSIDLSGEASKLYFVTIHSDGRIVTMGAIKE